MIQNYKDYRHYIVCDCIALYGADFNRLKYIIPKPWEYTRRYLRALRRMEYITNVYAGRIFKIMRLMCKIKLARLSAKTGITIPPNTFGKGLGLFHYGCIIINGSARFGDWCVVQCGVNVSEHVKGGDFVYLAPGCKINENLTIADSVIVGSNAVLTKNAEENGCTYVGLPAKKISEKGHNKVMGLNINEVEALLEKYYFLPFYKRYKF